MFHALRTSQNVTRRARSQSEVPPRSEMTAESRFGFSSCLIPHRAFSVTLRCDLRTSLPNTADAITTAPWPRSSYEEIQSILPEADSNPKITLTVLKFRCRVQSPSQSCSPDAVLRRGSHQEYHVVPAHMPSNIRLHQLSGDRRTTHGCKALPRCELRRGEERASLSGRQG
ncbi:hypothetical protein B0H14DRAFT_555939 [Mycena olivaceomarginata]|nr:hypothetical protein B0H14DRAFT_555939 [Mycena olivaceomarginata]